MKSRFLITLISLFVITRLNNFASGKTPRNATRTDLSKCKLTHFGIDYQGQKGTTAGGIRCQSWRSQNPIHKISSDIKDRDFPEKSMKLAKNYCRNPTADPKGPWCYTMDSSLIDDECGIPLCNFGECRISGTGAEYGGTKKISVSGKKCMSWDKRYKLEHGKTKKMSSNKFPDRSRDHAQSFCRNPNDDPGGPWCYVEEEDFETVVKEYCDIPFCDDKDCLIFAQNASVYSTITKFNKNEGNITLWIKLWNPGNAKNAEARILLSHIPVPTSSKRIAHDWRAGIEIVFTNEESGQIYPKPEGEQYSERTLNIIVGTKWTGIWILWAGGFVSAGLHGSTKPLFIDEFRKKNTIAGLHRYNFYYYGLMGTGVLWGTELCQNDCQMHITFGLEYIRLWPIQPNNSTYDVNFYVRASRDISIRLYQTPGSRFPCYTITIGDSETIRVIYQFSDKSTKQQLKDVPATGMLDFWTWKNFILSILGPHMRLFSERPHGKEEILYVKHNTFATMRWFSVGSRNNIAMWTFFCQPETEIQPQKPTPPNCITDLKDYRYQGDQWTSSTEMPCVPWSSAHIPDDDRKNELFVDGSAIKAINKCRNPGQDVKGPYCYTISVENRLAVSKQYCAIRTCRSSECRVAGTANDYVGTLSVTRSGRTCAKWMSDYDYELMKEKERMGEEISFTSTTKKVEKPTKGGEVTSSTIDKNMKEINEFLNRNKDKAPPDFIDTPGPDDLNWRDVKPKSTSKAPKHDHYIDTPGPDDLNWRDVKPKSTSKAPKHDHYIDTPGPDDLNWRDVKPKSTSKAPKHDHYIDTPGPDDLNWRDIKPKSSSKAPKHDHYIDTPGPDDLNWRDVKPKSTSKAPKHDHYIDTPGPDDLNWRDIKSKSTSKAPKHEHYIDTPGPDDLNWRDVKPKSTSKAPKHDNYIDTPGPDDLNWRDIKPKSTSKKPKHDHYIDTPGPDDLNWRDVKPKSTSKAPKHEHYIDTPGPNDLNWRDVKPKNSSKTPKHDHYIDTPGPDDLNWRDVKPKSTSKAPKDDHYIDTPGPDDLNWRDVKPKSTSKAPKKDNYIDTPGPDDLNWRDVKSKSTSKAPKYEHYIDTPGPNDLNWRDVKPKSTSKAPGDNIRKVHEFLEHINRLRKREISSDSIVTTEREDLDFTQNDFMNDEETDETKDFIPTPGLEDIDWSGANLLNRSRRNAKDSTVKKDEKNNKNEERNPHRDIDQRLAKLLEDNSAKKNEENVIHTHDDFKLKKPPEAPFPNGNDKMKEVDEFLHRMRNQSLQNQMNPQKDNLENMKEVEEFLNRMRNQTIQNQMKPRVINLRDRQKEEQERKKNNTREIEDFLNRRKHDRPDFIDTPGPDDVNWRDVKPKSTSKAPKHDHYIDTPGPNDLNWRDVKPKSTSKEPKDISDKMKEVDEYLNQMKNQIINLKDKQEEEKNLKKNNSKEIEDFLNRPKNNHSDFIDTPGPDDVNWRDVTPKSTSKAPKGDHYIDTPGPDDVNWRDVTPKSTSKAPKHDHDIDTPGPDDVNWRDVKPKSTSKAPKDDHYIDTPGPDDVNWRDVKPKNTSTTHADEENSLKKIDKLIGELSSTEKTTKNLEHSTTRRVDISKLPKPIHPVNPEYFNDTLYPEHSVRNASNYCRDPSRNLAGTWCYTTDPEVPQDLCNVRDCDLEEECTFFVKGEGAGRRLYILPEHRSEGLDFSLKAWEPDRPDSITFVFLADSDRKSRYVLKVGALDNEKVMLYYQGEEGELKLVKEKTLPHLLYLGKWSSFVIKIPRGRILLYYQGATNPLFHWEHPEPAKAFLPMYYHYASEKGHTIGVHFNCAKRCHIENTQTSVFSRILPISIWSKKPLASPNRIEFVIRSNGVVQIPLFLFPGAQGYYGMVLGESYEWIQFVKFSYPKMTIFKKQKVPAALFSTKTWTNITLTWSNKTIYVWWNGSMVFNYEHTHPLLFYYFSIGINAGHWAIWAANCIPADIDGEPIDGGWSEWGPWACSASCNGGVGVRKRTCDNPVPNVKGEPCLGPDVMSGRCNMIICGDITDDTLQVIKKRTQRGYTALSVQEGKSITIDPDVDVVKAVKIESPKSDIDWSHNGLYLRPDSTRINIVNYKIVIKNAKLNDSGVYALSFRRVDGSHVIFKMATLVVYPVKTLHTIRETLPLTVICHCVTLGYLYTDLNISWTIGRKLWKSYGITLPISVNVDSVPAVNKSHHGLWQCIVQQDDLGFKWTTNAIFVNVIGPPNWRTHLMEDEFTRPIFGWMPNEAFVAASAFVIFVMLTICIIVGTVYYIRLRNLGKFGGPLGKKNDTDPNDSSGPKNAKISIKKKRVRSIGTQKIEKETDKIVETPKKRFYKRGKKTSLEKRRLILDEETSESP